MIHTTKLDICIASSLQGSHQLIPLAGLSRKPFKSLFYSKEYIDTLKKIYREVSCTEVTLVHLARISHSHSESERFKQVFELNLASKLLTKDIINVHLPYNESLMSRSKSYQLTALLKQALTNKDSLAKWGIKECHAKYNKTTNLLNKALLICPKADVKKITAIATMIDQCKCKLPSIL